MQENNTIMRLATFQLEMYESRIGTSYFLLLSSYFLVLSSYLLVLTSYFLLPSCYIV